MVVQLAAEQESLLEGGKLISAWERLQMMGGEGAAGCGAAWSRWHSHKAKGEARKGAGLRSRQQADLLVLPGLCSSLRHQKKPLPWSCRGYGGILCREHPVWKRMPLFT